MNKHAFARPTYNAKAIEQAAGSSPIRPLKVVSPAALLDGLPRIPSTVLESLNMIFRGDRRISFEWPDGSVCTVVLLPEFKRGLTGNQSAKQVICNKKQGMAVTEVYRQPRGQGAELVIEARLGGRHSISIGLASAACLELLDGENAALLPPEIKCALLESYLDDAVWRFEQAAGLLISIDAITHSPIELPDRGYNLFFELQRQGGRSSAHGYLSLDVQSLTCLAEILKHQDHPLTWDRIDDLRIPVGFVLGSTRLRLWEINRLAGDDIVLLESITGQSNQSLSIRIDVAGNPFWLAKKNGNHLVVEKRVEHAMEDHAKKAMQENEDLTDLENIELELVFELARMSMSLADVRRIGRGYIFDLDSECTKPIFISINGNRIGSGELVKIDNRLGVRLTQYLPRQEHRDH